MIVPLTIRSRRPLAGDAGVTAVEFALVAPIFLLMLMGMFVLGQQVYASALLQGALQQAARDSTLERGQGDYGKIDARLEEAVLPIIPGATIVLQRRNFATFADTRIPEQFTDTNGNGKCDDGEPFEDIDGDGILDADRGRDGIGGARDAVVLTATATYDRLIPIPSLTGLEREVTLRGRTVLRNQPFDAQGKRVAKTSYCK